MTYAFVPTLFAALEAGKAVPQKSTALGHARVRRNSAAPLSFKVEDTMRSFSLTFQFRADKDGVVAAIGGQSLAQRFEPFRRSYGSFSWDTESAEFKSMHERFAATLSVDNGALTYHGADGNAVSTSEGLINGHWHTVTLTHYVARGESLLYVDGKLRGSLAEHLQPDSFVLGGPADKASPMKGAAADFREWMIHRSGLTAGEVAALHQGVLLKSSLELYAPLREGKSNQAQSLSEIAIEESRLSFVR